MMKLSRLGKVLLVIYIILSISDIATTLLVVEKFSEIGGANLETNPVHRFAGFGGIIFFNILFAACICFMFRKGQDSPNLHFFYTHFIVMLSMARILAIKNAVMNYFQEPAVIEAAVQTTTTAVKNDVYFGLIFFVMVLPTLLAMTSYFLFRMEYEIIKKK